MSLLFQRLEKSIPSGSNGMPPSVLGSRIGLLELARMVRAGSLSRDLARPVMNSSTSFRDDGVVVKYGIDDDRRLSSRQRRQRSTLVSGRHADQGCPDLRVRHVCAVPTTGGTLNLAESVHGASGKLAQHVDMLGAGATV